MPKGHFTRPLRFKRTNRPILYVIGPSIAYVQLTKGCFSVIDAEDGPRVGESNWCLVGKYAESHDGQGRPRKLLHRFIFGPTENTVDHVCTQSKLDNRRANLREANYSMQGANKSKQKNNTSGHPGVRFRYGKWRSQIQFNSKQISLGAFNSFEDACEAYRSKHRELFGEFSIFKSSN